MTQIFGLSSGKAQVAVSRDGVGHWVGEHRSPLLSLFQMPTSHQRGSAWAVER